MIPRYECARCGHRSAADAMIYSHWTRNRYCANVDACARRRKRRRTK